jgi:hypothetical protein
MQITSALFWDITQRIYMYYVIYILRTDISGQPIGPIFKWNDYFFSEGKVVIVFNKYAGVESGLGHAFLMTLIKICYYFLM